VAAPTPPDRLGSSVRNGLALKTREDWHLKLFQTAPWSCACSSSLSHSGPISPPPLSIEIASSMSKR
jgi:hypothetical protein